MAWWSPGPPRGAAARRAGGVPVAAPVGASTSRSGSTPRFDEVVAACADPRRAGGWIDGRIRAAYHRLHELGWAHSVEAWRDGRLVGGLYGVAIGGLFAGESMFHRGTRRLQGRAGRAGRRCCATSTRDAPADRRAVGHAAPREPRAWSRCPRAEYLSRLPCRAHRPRPGLVAGTRPGVNEWPANGKGPADPRRRRSVGSPVSGQPERNRTMKLKRALATGAAIVIAGFSLTACGSDGDGDGGGGGGDASDAGDSPDDASDRGLLRGLERRQHRWRRRRHPRRAGRRRARGGRQAGRGRHPRGHGRGRPQRLRGVRRVPLGAWTATTSTKFAEANPTDPDAFADALGIDEDDADDVIAFITYASQECYVPPTERPEPLIHASTRSGPPGHMLRE